MKVLKEDFISVNLCVAASRKRPSWWNGKPGSDALIAVDLSAAFNTVDLSILIDVLNKHYELLPH